MGVTIHYGGYLLNQDSFKPLIARVQSIADRRGWRMIEVVDEPATLIRVKDGKVDEYESVVNGIVLFPEQDCEPLRLEFEEDGFVQGFVKTQSAPIEVHCQIVELLDACGEFMRDFWVEDEGECWESRDVEVLSEKLDFLNKRFRH